MILDGCLDDSLDILGAGRGRGFQVDAERTGAAVQLELTGRAPSRETKKNLPLSPDYYVGSMLFVIAPST